MSCPVLRRLYGVEHSRWRRACLPCAARASRPPRGHRRRGRRLAKLCRTAPGPEHQPCRATIARCCGESWTSAACRHSRKRSDAQGVRARLAALSIRFHHLFVPWVLRRPTPARAERMQAVLEEVGGLWVKLGQALALRFDILPADYCLQFFQLLNQIQPFAAEDARSIIEHELRRPVDALFRSFDWQPHAAASIGQVYRAVLPDGTPVAVKVQRPRIRELIRADLTLMRGLAALIDLTPLFGHTRARALVQEFARWTEEELDYRIEARHAAVLRRNADGDPLERNPRVYPEYTTARVLTLEYLDGIPVIDIVTAIRRSDTAFLDAPGGPRSRSPTHRRPHRLERAESDLPVRVLPCRSASGEPHRPSRRCDRLRRLRDRGQARRSDHRGASVLCAKPVRGTHGRCRRRVHAVPDPFRADRSSGQRDAT